MRFEEARRGWCKAYQRHAILAAKVESPYLYLEFDINGTPRAIHRGFRQIT